MLVKETKNYKRFIIVMIALVVLFSSLLIAFVLNVQSLLEEDAFNRVNQMTIQLKSNLENALGYHSIELNNMAIKISEIKEPTEEDFNKIIASEKANFENIQYVNSNGKGYNLKNSIYYSNAEIKDNISKGKFYVTDPYLSSGKYLITQTIPIIKDKKVLGALLVDSEVTGINELCNSMSDVNSDGFVINQKQDILFKATNNRIDIINDDLNSLIKDKFADYEEDKANPILSLNNRGDKYYISFRALDNTNGWYVVLLAPSESIITNGTNIINQTMKVAGALIIVLLLVFLFSYLQQKVYDNKMLRFAYEDKLTGLSSYMKFCVDVNNKIKNAKDKEYALILFDVNKFKVINETYGFEIGDIILKKLAEAMQECISSEGLCCRMSNDFYLIFEKYSGNKMDILRIMSLIEGRIKDLQINESHKINILISTGVFIFDKDEASEYNGNLTKYISRAKMAHATVKGKHDVRVRFFDEKIQSDFKEERNIENEMDKALEKGEFEVYYQPKYDLVRGCVAGAEALIRWNHPQKGLVYPNDFIPVFEKNGFIIQIDEFMFDTACKDIREWLDEGIEPVRISVNLSRNHIRSGDMIDMLKSSMARYKVDPKYLEIELTESIAYEDINALREIVERIHNIDLSISIDDFGSGYSSLSLLEAIEFDVLKLDKTFLNNLEKNVKSKVILEHIIALAKAINVVVLCEGVETQEQADYLRGLGCDLIQGFLFSKALRKQDFEALL